MKNRYEWNVLFRLGVVIMGAILSILSIYVSFMLHFGTTIPTENFAAFQSAFIWIVLGFVAINVLFGTYVYYNKSVMDLFFLSLLTQVFLNGYLMALTYAGNWLTFPRRVIFINFIVGTVVLFAWNLIVYWIYHRLRGEQRIMIVGEEQRVLAAVSNFDMMSSKRHRVTHAVITNYYLNVVKYASEVDTVYVSGHIEETERIRIYDYLMKQNKKMFVSTEFQNLMMVNTNIMNFEDESIIEVSPFRLSAENRMLKRLLDVSVSGVLLLIASPIMLITAMLVKLETPGPVFYKQERVTLNQRQFNILKFRSMGAKAEAESGPVLATSNDARVTKVGKWIRSLRIDELPQLINVLRGDMSLVGPRPERPFFVEQFNEQNPYYSLRHHVRAGITGYAQVYGKYATDFNSKLNFDLLYIKKYSLTFDCKLLFQTVKILFDKVSSQGVESDDLKVKTWHDFNAKIKVIRS